MPTVVDFETEAIEDRPAYPPKPCGVAILREGERQAHYYAFGHAEGNNCTLAEARGALEAVWGTSLLFHNSKFDLDVAEVHFGLPIPPWERVHDTLFLLFLLEPDAQNFRLKESCERIFQLASVEQSAVRNWLIAHKFTTSVDSKWGRFICKAPGGLVGTYSEGDCTRTDRLFHHLFGQLDLGLSRAYDRERRLMPVLLANERRGMRVDLEGLARVRETYHDAVSKTEAWIRGHLGEPLLNLNSAAALAAALRASGEVTQFVKTPTGKDSVSKKVLTPELFRTPGLAQALGYRGRLATVLKMSIDPWLVAGQAGKGRITTRWNQVYGEAGAGARTGRLSCARFMNISKSFEGRGDGYEHPAFLGVPPLPLVRSFVLPDSGEVFCHRDYNQQELRILAHFEDGALLRAFQEDSMLDVHSFVQRMIQDLLGLSLDRSVVKTINFGRIYGMGASTLATRLKITDQCAKEWVAAHAAALPGVRVLEAAVRLRTRSGLPVRTWGGRRYFAEPGFEYKLLNYLIQGSAADCTKEALIRYDQARKHGKFLVAVHDEINFSCPQEHVASEMKILDDVMQSVEFDVKMLSEGKVGESWGALKKYQKELT